MKKLTLFSLLFSLFITAKLHADEPGCDKIHRGIAQEKPLVKQNAYCAREETYNPAPYREYNSYNLYTNGSGEPSRYSTSQGWSRSYSYWSGKNYDLPATGYTAPSRQH
jgi:hypothetical protein